MPLVALVLAVESQVDDEVYIVLKEYEMANAPAQQKNTYKMSATFIVRESLKGIDKNTRHRVELDGSVCYIVRRSQQVVGYVFTDKLYPARIAFRLLEKVILSFMAQTEDKWKTIQKDCNITIPQARKFFQMYQNPAKVDKVLQATEKVNEVKIIMHENIRKLLQRQGSLEQLVDKSKDLPEAAKKYYRTTKQMNPGCCQTF